MSSPKASPCRRGQIYIIDFIISISIFMVLLVISYSMWAGQSSKATDGLELSAASAAAARVLDSVTNSPGEPPSWAQFATDPSSASLYSIGTAPSQGNLDHERLRLSSSFFNSSTYHNATRLKLGFGMFEGDIRVIFANGTPAYTLGPPPNSNNTVLFSASRLASLSGSPAWVRVRVWKQVVP